jgi:hypothetical protein
MPRSTRIWHIPPISGSRGRSLASLPGGQAEGRRGEDTLIWRQTLTGLSAHPLLVRCRFSLTRPRAPTAHPLKAVARLRKVTPLVQTVMDGVLTNLLTNRFDRGQPGRYSCGLTPRSESAFGTAEAWLTTEAVAPRQTVTAALTATRCDPSPSADHRPRHPNHQNDPSSCLAGFS